MIHFSARRGPAREALLTGRGIVALTVVGALLAACGSPGVRNPVPTNPVPTPPTSGCVPTAGVSAMQPLMNEPLTNESGTSSIPSVMGSAPDWSAPRVAGQLLVVSTAQTAMSPQSLRVLAGVATERLTQDVTLLRTPAGQTDRAFAASLEAQGLQVQPDYLYRALAQPNDPGAPRNASYNFV